MPRRPADDDRPQSSAPTCVVDAVRGTLDGATPVAAAHDALVAIALTLAHKLDEGAGMATAAVASELRATLSEIFQEEAEDDDGLNRFLAGLSAPVGDAPKP